MMRKSDLVFLIAGVFATAAAIFCHDMISESAVDLIKYMLLSMWIVIGLCWQFGRND